LCWSLATTARYLLLGCSKYQTCHHSQFIFGLDLGSQKEQKNKKKGGLTPAYFKLCHNSHETLSIL